MNTSDKNDTAAEKELACTFTELSEKASIIMISLDNHFNVTSWNSAAETIFGYNAGDAVGKNICDLLIDVNEVDGLHTFLSQIKEHSEKTIRIIPKILKTQNDIYTNWYCQRLKTEKNKPSGIAVLIKDTIEVESVKDNLEAIEKNKDEIFDGAPIGIYRANIEGQFLAANPELAWMMGYESYEVLIDEMRDMASQMFADEENAEEFFFTLFEAEKVSRFRCRLKRKDGSALWTQSYAQVTRNKSGRIDGFYGYCINIATTVRAEMEMKRMNEELTRLSIMDGLTQIANRRRFDDVFRHEWKRLRREQQPLSIILCDIDHFKLFNDSYGHKAGDECLIKVAKAIEGSVNRPTDLVARYGGEEFVVVLANTSSRGANFVAEKMRNRVRDLDIERAGPVLNEIVTISLGVSSIIPTEAFAPDDLVKMADSALYAAKDQGRDQFVYKELK